MSKEHTDFTKALELKRKNMPTTLYRYRSIKTELELKRLIDSIRSGNIYCAHRDTLNDPFELRAPLSSKKASSYLGTNKTKKSIYLEHLKKHFDESEFAEVMQGDDWYEKLQRLIFSKQTKQDGLSIEYVENALNAVFMKQIEDLGTAYENIFNMNRITSFSEDSKNLPMWQHYADAHRGVCLAYDMSGLDIITSNALYPVLYVKELPDVVKFSFEHFGKDEKPPFGITLYHCIHKLADWSYEKEWRYVYQPGMHYYSHENIPLDYWDNGIEVAFTTPVKIILGNKVDNDVKSKLLKIVRNQGVSIAQMHITPYGLEEIEII